MINPIGVPLLNSFILLRRAASVTWSHFSLLENKESSLSLLVTVFFSIYFIIIQAVEYLDS
jgi:cytochrome c oxidase subunit III